MNAPARLDQLCMDTLRTLSIEAVQNANSGHPGKLMGAAPTAYFLWQRFPRFNQDEPNGRTATASCCPVGHASALLYSLLYLFGVKGQQHVVPEPAGATLGGVVVTLVDLKGFRQAGSRWAQLEQHAPSV